MDLLHFRHHYSRQMLFRMLIMTSLAVALAVWKLDFILDIYFRKQLTTTGLIINGGIIALFLLGMARIVYTFLVYAREERALLRFVKNLRSSSEGLLRSVPDNSIISRRVRLMQQLHQQRAPISHGALASILVAAESTRTSLPKFINNVLILTGVFGTIVSLSIALIGASNLLESMIEAEGMGLVIHGMSTALSTTITAILCYLFFGYFYLKLSDTQTNLISGIEQVTASTLIPRFHIQSDTVLYEFSGLIRSLQGLVNQMVQSQASFENIEKRLMDGAVGIYQGRLNSMSEGISGIQGLLRQGFRLPEDR